MQGMALHQTPAPAEKGATGPDGEESLDSITSPAEDSLESLPSFSTSSLSPLKSTSQRLSSWRKSSRTSDGSEAKTKKLSISPKKVMKKVLSSASSSPEKKKVPATPLAPVSTISKQGAAPFMSPLTPANNQSTPRKGTAKGTFPEGGDKAAADGEGATITSGETSLSSGHHSYQEFMQILNNEKNELTEMTLKEEETAEAEEASEAEETAVHECQCFWCPSFLRGESKAAVVSTGEE